MIELAIIDLVPDPVRLAEMFSQAIAPAFFLGAIGGFLSLMTTRLHRVATKLHRILKRVQAIQGGEEDDPARAQLKEDIERLRYRARCLTSGIKAALHSGLCATGLLSILFASSLFQLKHAYGAPMLFVMATLFLGFALFRFWQESRISFTGAVDYHYL